MSSAAKKAELEKQIKQQEKLQNLLVTHNKIKKNNALEASKETLANTFKYIISPYHKFCFRDPNLFVSKIKSDSADRLFLEFIQFCFGQYKTPKILKNAGLFLLSKEQRNIRATGNNVRQAAPWLGINRRNSEINKNNNQRPDFSNETFLGRADLFYWLISIISGKMSFYKDTTANIYFTKKEAHRFLNCNYDITINEAAIFAIAKTFAKTDSDALKISKTKLATTPFKKTVKEAIYFFSRNPDLPINEIDDIIDFVVYPREDGERPFSFVGQTIESLRKKTKDWHYSLRRAKVLGNEFWAGAPIDDQVIETINVENGKTDQWRFKQIKSSKELAAEGTAMHHCVLSYKHRCILNKSYIFSVTKVTETQTKRVLTIELDNSGFIVQVRGFANRTAKNSESAVVKKWAIENGLFYSY